MCPNLKSVCGINNLLILEIDRNDGNGRIVDLSYIFRTKSSLDLIEDASSLRSKGDGSGGSISAEGGPDFDDFVNSPLAVIQTAHRSNDDSPSLNCTIWLP